MNVELKCIFAPSPHLQQPGHWTSCKEVIPNELPGWCSNCLAVEVVAMQEQVKMLKQKVAELTVTNDIAHMNNDIADGELAWAESDFKKLKTDLEVKQGALQEAHSVLGLAVSNEPILKADAERAFGRVSTAILTNSFKKVI